MLKNKKEEQKKREMLDMEDKMTKEEIHDWLKKCPSAYWVSTRDDYQRMKYKEHLMLHLIGNGIEETEIFKKAKAQVDWDNCHYDEFARRVEIERAMFGYKDE